jgi:hypothetical protein
MIQHQAVPTLYTLIQDVDVLVHLDAMQAVCGGAYHKTARPLRHRCVPRKAIHLAWTLPYWCLNIR